MYRRGVEHWGQDIEILLRDHSCPNHFSYVDWPVGNAMLHGRPSLKGDVLNYKFRAVAKGFFKTVFVDMRFWSFL